MAEKLTPGRIALLYAVTGCLWILFSDQLVALLFRDPRTNLLISEFKGWGFIFVTALLLFWLIRDSREQLVHSEAELRRKNLVLAENREKLLRYELLAGNSRDIILFLRRDDGRIMEANAAAMITYGYDHQELLAMTIQELRAADAASETSTLMDVADAHGLLFETVHRRKDGSTFPVEVSSQGATIGDTRMLISVIRDITQRREMERSLRLWADAFESCAHGMAIGNPATNTILTCNPAFARLYRQKVEEIVDVPILSLYAQDEHDQVRQRIAEVNQTGTLCFESVMQRRDGSRFPVQVDTVNVRAADGQLLHRIMTVQDITERRQTMELLEKSRLNLLTILDNLPFMAWLKDTEGRFIAVNRPFADSCCHTDPEQLVGKTDLDVYPEHLALSYRADDQDVMASRQKKALEEIVAYHGVEKWFETFKAPLFDLDGRVIGTTGVSRDITEQKAAEEAVRASGQRWRQLAEAMPQLVWTCTPDGACD
ncbi:MAG TPA: PAS domain S-box protein, partial [Geobacteraceae bacterium]